MQPWLPIRIWSRAQDTYRSWRRHDGNLLAASIAYYGAVSFFPLLLVLIASLGFFLRFTGRGHDAQHRLLQTIAHETSPHLARQIEVVMQEAAARAPISGPVGMVILMVASITIFVHFEQAFDRIWDQPRSPSGSMLAAARRVLYHRLRAFVMLLGVGLLILASLLSSIALSTIATFAREWLPLQGGSMQLARTAISLGLNALSFTAIYRILPKRPVRLVDAARGGLLVAVVWEVGSRLLAMFLTGERSSAYGVVGSFLVILLWIYYASALLLLGGEYVRSLSSHGRPLSDSGAPSSTKRG